MTYKFKQQQSTEGTNNEEKGETNKKYDSILDCNIEGNNCLQYITKVKTIENDNKKTAECFYESKEEEACLQLSTHCLQQTNHSRDMPS